MDLDTYNTVLQRRGENPYEIADGTFYGDTRGRIAFRKDLIEKKVIWYNDPKEDWHAFLKNYHPLYSICTAPPEHPFTRKERLAVFIADLGLAACLALFVALAGIGLRETDTDDSKTDFEVTLIVLKCIASICSGFIKAVSNGLLKYMMVCPCCDNDSCPTFCRRCWGIIGHLITCIWSCAVFLMLMVMIAVSVMNHVTKWFILSFIISNISGWIFSLMFLSCCFRIRWKKEKVNDKDVLNKFRISYLDYEKYKKQTMSEFEGQAMDYPLLDDVDLNVAIQANNSGHHTSYAPL